jgi:hypothetical protein
MALYNFQRREGETKDQTVRIYRRPAGPYWSCATPAGTSVDLPFFLLSKLNHIAPMGQQEAPQF